MNIRKDPPDYVPETLTRQEQGWLVNMLALKSTDEIRAMLDEEEAKPVEQRILSRHKWVILKAASNSDKLMPDSAYMVAHNLLGQTAQAAEAKARISEKLRNKKESHD
jgi:hypothetical protein